MYIYIVMNHTLITYLKNHIEAFSGQSFIVYGVEGKDVLEVAEDSSEVLKWDTDRYLDTLTACNKLAKFLKTFLP